MADAAGSHGRLPAAFTTAGSSSFTDFVRAAAPEPASDVQERVSKLTDDVDALLDDIDEALEENAEDFVRGYVQKGGQ